jgi:hypothetical protein
VGLAGFVAGAPAAVLPEDRSDLFYHYYDGGGVTVNGPALLVRKSVGDNVSVAGRYYVDAISSASIDVITTASPFKDEREEFGLNVDVLHGNSLLSLGLTTSKEDDYLADTVALNVAHELNGGLTTVNLGFAQGRDVVQRVDTSFEDSIDRYSFRLGLSQVLTRSLLLGVNFEDVAENGYLSNPYRAARVLGAFQPERYPRTRDSQALAIRLVKGFGAGDRPLGRSLRAEYRYFQDNWDIRANTLALTWQRYFGDRRIGELRYRYYTQSAASFYSDNFSTDMTYLARDKELSSFTSHSLGIKLTRQFVNRPRVRVSFSLAFDRVLFDYEDFTDLRTGQPYSFDANVWQGFVTFLY